MQAGRGAYDPPRGPQELRAGLDAWCDAVEEAAQSADDWWTCADDLLRDIVDNSSAVELFRALEA